MNALLLREIVMAGLFDVSKETILVTGASPRLGRQFARVLSAHAGLFAELRISQRHCERSEAIQLR
jgi:NAD(P)-dependent dehydrogenase (short-subunit alcohol dehydrogenase family)